MRPAHHITRRHFDAASLAKAAREERRERKTEQEGKTPQKTRKMKDDDVAILLAKQNEYLVGTHAQVKEHRLRMQISSDATE